jgi:hypothetical protein
MKLIVSNGRQLEVFEVSGPIYRLSAGVTPIKLHSKFLVEDAEARALVCDARNGQEAGKAGPDGGEWVRWRRTSANYRMILHVLQCDGQWQPASPHTEPHTGEAPAPSPRYTKSTSVYKVYHIQHLLFYP